MFPPHLMGRPQKKADLIPEHWKLPLRVVGFAVAVFAIVNWGDQLEMPEAPRV